MSLQNGIALYYNMEGNSNDSVGSLNGTDTSISYATANGIINQGAAFNGTSSKITGSTSTTLDAGNSFSVSFWIKMNAFPTGNAQNAVNKLSVGSQGWMMYTDNSQKFYLFGYGLPTIFVAEANTYSTGVWYHYVGTYDGATLKIYRNGTLSNSAASAGTITASGNAMTVGDYNGMVGSFIDGSIDEVGIWNRPITDSEVLALYNSGSGQSYPFYNQQGIGNGGVTYLPSTSTKAYFQFNGDCVDFSGNNVATTRTAITYVAGRYAQAASFNGSTSYIQTSAAVTTGTSATFSFWLYKTNDDDQAYFCENDYSDNSMCFFDAATDKINYRFGATNMISTVANPVANNTWNLITCTHTGTAGTIYINGVLAASGTVNAKTSSGTALTVGRLGQLGIYYFNGQMDEMIVENRAWNIEEVHSYYANSIGKNKVQL